VRVGQSRACLAPELCAQIPCPLQQIYTLNINSNESLNMNLNNLPVTFSTALPASPASAAEQSIFAAFGRVLAVHPDREAIFLRTIRQANTLADANTLLGLRNQMPRGGGGGGDGGDGGNGGGGKGGGNSGGGGGNPPPPPPAPPPPPPTVTAFWWGLQFTFTEPALKGLLLSDNIEAAALGVLSAALFEIPIAAIIVAALAAVIAIQAQVYAAVDQGNGIYLSMLWIAPEVFVPTAII